MKCLGREPLAVADCGQLRPKSPNWASWPSSLEVSSANPSTAAARRRLFELAVTLPYQRLTSAAKRNSPETDICWNCRLDDAPFVCKMRKPFDVLAEGLVSSESRGDGI
jgi:hypothetical protein